MSTLPSRLVLLTISCRRSEPCGSATHSSKIPYVFNNLRDDREWTATDHQLAETISSYWVNFAASGDPNGAGLPHWPAFDGDSTDTVMVLGDQPGAGSVLNRNQMTMFQTYYDRLKQ